MVSGNPRQSSGRGLLLMQDFLTIIAVVGGWIALQYFILPRLGVPT